MDEKKGEEEEEVDGREEGRRSKDGGGAGGGEGERRERERDRMRGGAGGEESRVRLGAAGRCATRTGGVCGVVGGPAFVLGVSVFVTYPRINTTSPSTAPWISVKRRHAGSRPAKPRTVKPSGNP